MGKMRVSRAFAGLFGAAGAAGQTSKQTGWPGRGSAPVRGAGVCGVRLTRRDQHRRAGCRLSSAADAQSRNSTVNQEQGHSRHRIRTCAFPRLHGTYNTRTMCRCVVSVPVLRSAPRGPRMASWQRGAGK